MIIIGEKINGTRKAVAKAIVERDFDFIRRLVERQDRSGSNYLDLNAGSPPHREPEDMVWLVENAQEVSDLPLCLDSANSAALKACLGITRKTPLINSLSGEKARIEGVLPLALEYKTGLIILALDDRTGVPKTSGERVEIVRRLVAMATEGGLAEEQLFIDPLVTAIATGTENALVTFDTIRQIKHAYPKAHVTSGLSNISFGMPVRPLINRAFLAMSVMAGLDSAIADPEDRELMGMVLAAEMLMGNDSYCQNFNRAFRAGLIGPDAQS
jgi:5-methyltetrahydrofolate--homocysteine methyltransferase